MNRTEIIDTFKKKLANKKVKPLDMQEALEDGIEMLKHDRSHQSYQRKRMLELKVEIINLKKELDAIREQNEEDRR